MHKGHLTTLMHILFVRDAKDQNLPSISFQLTKRITVVYCRLILFFCAISKKWDLKREKGGQEREILKRLN